MVAVLDTKPDASADNAHRVAYRMSRLATCASDWITSSTDDQAHHHLRVQHALPQGVLGASGYTSKASAARMSPLRTSPGCSHWLENWCSASRSASSPSPPPPGRRPATGRARRSPDHIGQQQGDLGGHARVAGPVARISHHGQCCLGAAPTATSAGTAVSAAAAPPEAPA